MTTDSSRERAALPLRFTIRDMFWLTLVVAVFLWFQYARPITVGRYQIELDQKLQRTVLLDTATGKHWHCDINGNWSPAYSPSGLK